MKSFMYTTVSDLYQRIVFGKGNRTEAKKKLIMHCGGSPLDLNKEHYFKCSLMYEYKIVKHETP